MNDVVHLSVFDFPILMIVFDSVSVCLIEGQENERKQHWISISIIVNIAVLQHQMRVVMLFDCLQWEKYSLKRFDYWKMIIISLIMPNSRVKCPILNVNAHCMHEQIQFDQYSLKRMLSLMTIWKMKNLFFCHFQLMLWTRGWQPPIRQDEELQKMPLQKYL